jgi:hypothetical protein
MAHPTPHPEQFERTDCERLCSQGASPSNHSFSATFLTLIIYYIDTPNTHL